MGHVGRQLPILTALLFTGRVFLQLLQPARVFFSRGARMASKGLREASEG
jgi:hypothetical protein